MKKIVVFLVVISFIISSCSTDTDQVVVKAIELTLQAIDSPTPWVIHETVEVPVIEEVIVTQIVEVTKEIQIVKEVPVTITFTPGPTPTPTITPSPTPTATFTPTATPFRVASCVDLLSVSNYWNIETSEYDDKLFPFYEKYNGKCVKFYYSGKLGIFGTDYGYLTLLKKMVTLELDEFSPTNVRKPFANYYTMWGIWVQKDKGKYQVLLRRVEEFPKQQQPILEDGFYMVGDDFDVSPGQWKSVWAPGTQDDCYWARTNPDTGNIKDNHFGLAGIYVRLSSGDMFESNRCAPWIFIKP